MSSFVRDSAASASTTSAKATWDTSSRFASLSISTRASPRKSGSMSSIDITMIASDRRSLAVKSLIDVVTFASLAQQKQRARIRIVGVDGKDGQERNRRALIDREVISLDRRRLDRHVAPQRHRR